MTLQELQAQVLKLPVHDRWQLVQSTLASIQQETIPVPADEALTQLHPWTQSLIGVLKLDGESPTAAYEEYLEEKYR
jgi:hypothetical protein